MSHTNTSNLNLWLPSHRDPDSVESWDGIINNNMGLIDTAFGNRAAYTVKAQGAPANLAITDTHSQSLNKLAEALVDVSVLTPSISQFAALVGTGVPSGSNPYVNADYVRINRSDILFPEYPGAVFTPSGSNNTGTLTSNMENATYRYNYYKWLTTEATMQSYDISVKWQVPATWLSWQANALTIDFCTEDAVATNCKVDATICKDGVLAITFPVVPWATGVASSVAGTWGTKITFTNANMATLSLAAGSILNILIRMYSMFDTHSHYVKIGNITLSYVG